MPTYDYACSSCGHEFDHMQPMTSDPLSECPSCGTSGLRRKIGAGGAILFKGDGFYETDYKKKQDPKHGLGEPT